LNRLFGRLKKFQDNADAAADDDQLGRSGSRVGKARYICYRGLAANSNPCRPPGGRKMPFQSCVSQAWAVRTGNEDVAMLEDPDNFTIFAFNIPSDDLDFDDLADEEDEGQEVD
jgi:hypothetical protein